MSAQLTKPSTPHIETAFRSIETDLHAVGATGVEDDLAENVPLAIQSLVKAKVQVVVLTGDKTETLA